MDKVLSSILLSIGGMVFIAGISLVLALPVKWCWNATMPYLFAWPIITCGKAWCLCFLVNCVFKSNVSSK